MTINRMLLSAGAAMLGLTMTTSAMAVPELQLFIEQSDYEIAGENTSDPVDSETWAKLGISSFRLWVIGGGSGNGPNPAIDATHRIRDVMFVASYDTGLAPSLTFTGALTNGLGGFIDGSTPGTPAGPTTVDIATLLPPPDYGDIELTPHSPLGSANRSAVQWNLGMFDEYANLIADFIPPSGGDLEATDDPFTVITPQANQRGQINVYEVLVTGLPFGAQVHFDVYGVAEHLVTTYKNGTNCLAVNGGGRCKTYEQVIDTQTWVAATPNMYVNAPFSHDARWEQAGLTIIADVPEPASMSLLGAGLLGLGYSGKRRKAA